MQASPITLESDITHIIPEQGYCSHSGLVGRGWTNAAIARFLKNPDKVVPNPHYNNGYPMKLYLLGRVEAAEKSTDYQVFCNKNKKRREASAKAVQTKQENLLKQIGRLEIHLHPQHIEEVMQDAINSFNSIRSDRSDEGFHFESASMDSNKEFLKRITVNFLRHRCTPYERQLEEMAGKVGKKEAYIELNRCIFRRISERYPELKSECERQLEEKIQLINFKV